MNFVFYTTTEDLKAQFEPTFLSLALTSFMQALMMLKSTRVLSFKSLVHNQISYQKQLFIPVFEKTFHLPQATCFSFFSASDLHTKEN